MTVDIANRLVQLRKEHHLSQEELAEKLGLSRQAVSKWERAEASPDTDNLILLSRLYGVSIDELLRTDAADEEVREKRAEEQNGAQDGQGKSRVRPQRVHVGWRGIHVQDGEETVHVGWDGIRVIDKDGNDRAAEHLFARANDEETAGRRKWTGAVSLVLFALYLVLGGVWSLWHPGWLILLLLPVLDSLYDAVRCRDPHRFAYPVLVVLVYLALGLFRGLWHPGWVVFISIPVYYMIFPSRQRDAKVTFGAVPEDLAEAFDAREDPEE